MPELPEVETIRRELKLKIINQRITGYKILRKEIIGYPKSHIFCKKILNQKIVDVRRRAKYLILILTDGLKLIFHLRLSGRIILKKLNGEDKFTRLIIKLNDYQLNFNEPRALGRVYLLKEDERPKVLSGHFNLSLEVISPEYDFNYFKNKLSGRKSAIKQLLLDQKICAGVGNIYSDEALFYAGIRTNGGRGNFQNFLYVYGKEGSPCRLCGARILLEKLGSRSTRYCPRCQR